MKISKETLMGYLKSMSQYVMILIALMSGFIIGKFHYKLEQVKEDTTNPFNHVRNIKNISIAVNEHNELMLINKNTGNYQIYSDSIGMSIFRMYSNKIYQNIKSHD